MYKGDTIKIVIEKGGASIESLRSTALSPKSSRTNRNHPFQLPKLCHSPLIPAHRGHTYSTLQTKNATQGPLSPRYGVGESDWIPISREISQTSRTANWNHCSLYPASNQRAVTKLSAKSKSFLNSPSRRSTEATPSDFIDHPITVMPPSRKQNTTLAMSLIEDLS
ncbi:hypothetical protein TNCV_1179341 [Trichonephila clavipes]|nr:hypothetical protein TNCV_1179341 [Trichonephila clavipes]